MEKEYLAPEIEIIKFEIKDVIITSDEGKKMMKNRIGR